MSPASTARMAKRYGHIGQLAQRQAVGVLDTKKPRNARKRPAKRPAGTTVEGPTEPRPDVN